MSVLAVALTLLLLAAVMAVVSRPLLVARNTVDPYTPLRADLEAEREAKYREIRDAELDYRTGKLSSEDYERVNAALRSEAVEILDRLQALDLQGGEQEQPLLDQNEQHEHEHEH